MADNEEGQEQEPESSQGRNWKALRERAETAEAKVREYEGRLLGSAIRDAGFDVEQPLGKMLRELYKGEPDVQAIQAFAKEKYGLETKPAASQSAVAGVEDMAARIDQLRAASTPITPPGGDSAFSARIAELEAKGDDASLMEAIALRDQWRAQQK